MLCLERPPRLLRGLLLLADDQDPDLYHYFPPAPRLARTEGGAPAFVLYKYRRDLTDNPALEPGRARGAGFASLEVEAEPKPGVLTLVRSELASALGRPHLRLAPVLFR